MSNYHLIPNKKVTTSSLRDILLRIADSLGGKKTDYLEFGEAWSREFGWMVSLSANGAEPEIMPASVARIAGQVLTSDLDGEPEDIVLIARAMDSKLRETADNVDRLTKERAIPEGAVLHRGGNA